MDEHAELNQRALVGLVGSMYRSGFGGSSCGKPLVPMSVVGVYLASRTFN